jgi:3-dehydroquinate synthetase
VQSAHNRSSRRWMRRSAGKQASICAAGKNLVGTFHQPLVRVLIDPTRAVDFAGAGVSAPGLYEALKCGVIGTSAIV